MPGLVSITFYTSRMSECLDFYELLGFVFKKRQDQYVASLGKDLQLTLAPSPDAGTPQVATSLTWKVVDLHAITTSLKHGSTFRPERDEQGAVIAVHATDPDQRVLRIMQHSPSRFAALLQLIINKTEPGRKFWEDALGIPFPVMETWLLDKAVPPATALFAIQTQLGNCESPKAIQAHDDFTDIIRQPAETVSPLGHLMDPTIGEYMLRSFTD